jgi:pyrimidine deaminase RibD-like protein
MRPEELPFAKQAIEQARLSKQEPGRTPIYVGAVAVRDAHVIASAHRCELALGEHAEYALLERKLHDVDLRGTTVFATLEPCTLRRAEKVPCAQRLIDRGVPRVVIGMLDPNADIRGLGYQALRAAGIAVELFDEPLVSELEDMNQDFVRLQRAGIAPPRPSADFLAHAEKRRLDDWYIKLNGVYFHRNFDRRATDICLHLIEVIGGLSLLASKKTKPGIDKERQVSKAVAWWLALCGKVAIRSVEDLLWGKFPAVCPYCQQSKHDQEQCAEKKAASPGPPWDMLAHIGGQRTRPERLGAWQRMFNDIYPVTQTDEYGPIFARLYEELAELAEAVRVFPSVPGYFLSEAADVFAWLMRVQNLIDEAAGRRRQQRGTELEKDFAKAYPDACGDCGRLVCACPPILGSTVGRIAHEVPPGRSSYGEGGSFLTPDKAAEQFGPTRRDAV